ncbi:MAG: ATP phosphoribosyltransferase [Phycisphaera sp.]|nr:ATP phosphoribosyltransferase [Phycisphaera sp.]
MSTFTSSRPSEVDDDAFSPSSIDDSSIETRLRLCLPKGRMQDGVESLLADAGLRVRPTSRGYRPRIEGIRGVAAKLMKPPAIVSMLSDGSRDLGFAGADWVRESGADLVEILDTGLDPVRIVTAAPAGFDLEAARTLRVASEMPNIAADWALGRGLRIVPVRSWGTTEVLPPEDADVVVDVVQTGATLEANGLRIMDVVMTSSTRLYASREAAADPIRRRLIDRVSSLIESVLEARSRLLVELNVEDDRLDAVLAALPCMRRPTVSPLAGGGFAVRSAVPRADVATLVLELKEAGGTDLVISEPRQVIP